VKKEKKKFEDAPELVRLNKFISHNSKYSRREADKLIEEGKVSVDGKVVTDMATKVSEDNKVQIGKQVIRVEHDKPITVIVYNKPKGELVTKKDPRGRKTIFDTLPSKFKHFMPIGRLDFASEGVLLLTDSVDVNNALMHSNLERIYKLKLNGPITKKVIAAMENGLELEDASKGGHEKSDIQGMTFAPFIAYQIISEGKNYSKIKVVIAEGKNRELRRFFGNFGLEVLDLKRLEFGGISLNNLPTGKSRYLSREEYRNLRGYLKEQKDDASS
jgi:23S rRNA pseudouridine2605 synthase